MVFWGPWTIIVLLVLGGALVALLIYIVREATTLKSSADSLQTELRQFKEGGFEKLIGEKLTPLARQASDVHRQLLEQEERQSAAVQQIQRDFGQVTAQISALGELQSKVGELNDLLKPQQLRGELGEVIVRTLISDKLPKSQYEQDYTFLDGKQVEFAIRLNDRLIPVDSKLPLDDYKRMQECTDETSRQAARTALKRTVKKKIDEVKAYIRPAEGTMNFALMVISSEAVYYDLIAGKDFIGEGGLYDYARERNVFLTSPSTFWAYITALAQGLRGLEIEQHAEQVLVSLQHLTAKLHQFTQDEFRKLGGHLRNAANQYDEAERRLRDIESGVSELERTETPPLSHRGSQYD